MRISRRQSLRLGATMFGGIGLTGLLPLNAWSQGVMLNGDKHMSETGEIIVRPISHASFVMSVPGMVIYTDPVGGGALYEGLPAPELILITHEHGDHYDADTLSAIMTDTTRLLTNPAVYDMLPAELQAKANAIANFETATVNDIGIEAIPAYNTTEDRLKYHPQGRDNGYVLSVDGRRIYIAGDTEDIPEMRALTDIDVAFLPMNLPYTMTVEQAASGVEAFTPGVVYPYHYKDSDPMAFEALVKASGVQTKVIQGPWY